MRLIKRENIISSVEALCADANIHLPSDVLKAVKRSCRIEQSALCRSALSQNIENARLAAKKNMPLCQDTGMGVFFVELGVDVKIEGSIYENINEGLRRGYKNNYLRASMVEDPLKRLNTKDNTPAFIHLKLVKGSSLKISFMPKGGGAENLSRFETLTPAEGLKGVRKFVLDTITEAGSTPCPPIIVGIGLGGNFETAPLLAKHSLLRKIGSKHKNPYYRKLESEFLDEINKTGIGAQGFGGTITALAVFIETHPCHISALPVAVNIQCHLCRHKTVKL